MEINSKCLSLKLITKQNNLNYFDFRSRTLTYNIKRVVCISYLKWSLNLNEEEI